MTTMMGGWSPEKSVTADVREIVDQVKAAAELKLGQNFDLFEATKYCSQVVAGTNYLVKVKIGCDSYIELRIFQSLQQNIELAGVKTGLTEDSPITYF